MSEEKEDDLERVVGSYNYSELVKQIKIGGGAMGRDNSSDITRSFNHSNLVSEFVQSSGDSATTSSPASSPVAATPIASAPTDSSPNE